MGSRSGWLAQTSISCIVWLFSVWQARPHMILHENVEHFDWMTLCGCVEAEYYCQSIVCSPTDMGIPVSRRRRSRSKPTPKPERLRPYVLGNYCK
eukprot:3932189-Amphidinium_carterae.1